MPFPSLPVPTLPPDPHLRNPFPFPADFLPDASVAGDDIDSALTEFLAAVVPQPLPVPDIPAADEGLLDDSLYGRRVYGNGFSSTDPVAFRIPKGLDDSHTKGNKEEGLRLEASAVTKDAVLHTLQKNLQEKMNKMRIVDSLNFIPATNQQQHLQTNHLTADSSKKIPTDVQLHNQGNLNEKNIVDSHNFVTAAEQLNTLNQITIANSQKFVPAVEKSSSTSSVSANVIKAPQDNYSAGVLPLSEKMDSTKAGRLPGPEAVIVVNTGNHGKNMIFSRRSSYQQILALKRGGMQVVERDVDLPVDLILTAAVCLLWYDTRTSGSSELTISSDTSGITNFVEDIANNILMELSFCFCGCILVFEGENHFLSAVLEASDSLYASAACLDMNLQLFFSQTPKSTDQIILNCIQNAVRINQAPCPQIPESESLVESFVTAFPSVSPLSAHMILSSSSLLDFIRCSHEQRTQAVEKYRLPPQSISLFSALCKFGELGESKSVMIECSSVDSDINSALLQSARGKKRCDAQDFSAAVSHSARPNPCTQLHGDCVENDKVFSPPKLRKFSHIEDMMPDLPEVFMIDQRLNMGSEGVSCQPRKYDVDAVTGIHIIDDDYINELTPNFRTYNERASSMVDTCNFSGQSKLRAKQPINVSCVNQTWTDNVHGDFATSSARNDLGSRYHETRQEIMQTRASSLSFLKQDFGCHGASQDSTWERDYLRQMIESRKACQEQSRCYVLAELSNSRTRDGSSRILSVPPIESFRYQRNTDTPFGDQSPSDIESFRHRRYINTLLRDRKPSNEAHRTYNARASSMMDTCNFSRWYELGAKQPISVSCGINQTWTDNVHGDFATSSGRNDVGSRYHEPRQEIAKTPASSFSFLKQDSGCHGASQGSGWQLNNSRQMNEQLYVDHLNVSNKEQLQKLKGIGTRRAEHILDLRESRPFKTLADLETIGVSPKEIEGIRKKMATGIYK